MFFSESVQFILKRLEKRGFSAYVVGGAVRDIIMGKTPSDYDIASSASPFEIKSIFSDFKVIETGIRHGTVTVIINNEAVEITSFRSDGEYIDSRHPERVSFGVSLEEDLSRRDFTINAMAMDKSGNLIDLFYGKRDIENKTLRAVGNPEKRFSEDALRILRGIRFISVLGFSAEERTYEAMIANKALLHNISGERKREEILKILSAPHFLSAAEKFLPVFNELFPNFSLESAEKISRIKNDAALKLAAALENSPFSALENLKLDKVTRVEIEKLLSANVPAVADEFYLKMLYTKEGDFGKKIIEFKAPEMKDLWEKLKKENAFKSKEDIPLKGEDMKALGFLGKEIKAAYDFPLVSLNKGEVSLEKEALLEHLGRNFKKIK